MEWVRGDQLPEVTRRDALARYVHRFTMEHVPAWALRARHDGTHYAPHFRSDAEWLANSRFRVNKGGELSAKPCETSGHTWPLGQSLDVPYQKGAL